MRTTIDLDPDVMAATKEIAKRQHKTAGQVVSELLRQALNASSSAGQSKANEGGLRYGFQPFPTRGGIVTNKLIDDMRDRVGD